MIILFLIAIGWPLAPQDSTQPLGNNWGEFQDYGGFPYMHPGIDVMGITVGGPVYAVQAGIVKAWLSTGGEWYWRLAIADYDTNDSVEAWLYAHIDSSQYHKNVGDVINEGDLIGYLVEWPIIGFDHCHFARIKDAGAVWQFADWAFVQNPLVLISPYDDTAKPVFENAYASNRFALCLNNTSSYLNPDSIYGSIDIIAKIYDETGLPLNQYPIWERLIPLRITYEIRGPQNVPPTLSFVFKDVLRYTENVDVIYKDDAVCDTRGDYDFRDYYFIVTNTDGDSIVEASDANYSWNTAGFSSGYYWVVVTASDAAGNLTKDSMMVTIPGPYVAEDISAKLSSNKIPTLVKDFSELLIAFDIKIFDINGRICTNGKIKNLNLPTGVYFAIYEKDAQFCCEKIVVIR